MLALPNEETLVPRENMSQNLREGLVRWGTPLSPALGRLSLEAAGQQARATLLTGRLCSVSSLFPNRNLRRWEQ